MKLDHVSDWFQLIASVAVVAGLLLVVQELRQGKQLAGAELIAVNYAMFAERELTILGEEPAGALVRSCMDPASVSDEDVRVLASYYQQLIFALTGMIEVELVGEFGTERWKPLASYQLLSILSTEHGRWYWNFVKPSLYPQLRELGEEILSEMGDMECAPFWESFRTRAPLPPGVKLAEPSG